MTGQLRLSHVLDLSAQFCVFLGCEGRAVKRAVKKKKKKKKKTQKLQRDLVMCANDGKWCKWFQCEITHHSAHSGRAQVYWANTAGHLLSI